MNMIFVTHGDFSFFYLNLLQLLREKLTLGNIGFYINHRSSYSRCLRDAKGLDLGIRFLAEWEIGSVADESIDCDFLKSLEDEFGDPFLWSTLVVDRRVYNGILTKYKQDYKPRFTHEEMLARLQKGFKSVLEFIGDIKPDIIVGGFTPVTWGEYIFYLCAKAKGIKYINLNPTKILNYVTFSQEVFREFPHITEDYEKYLELSEKDAFLEKAEDYAKNKSDKYEGVIVYSLKFPWKKWFLSILKWPLVMARYYLRKDYLDNQVRGEHWGYFFANIYNPVKDKAVQKFVPYYSVEKLNQVEYAYYPLHVEPEIALSLFGKEYLNQIELARNIAKSIPVTWKLAVKDHPAGVGRRNVGYYKRLLEIPNVVLVNHFVDSKHLIENAKMIFTVSGFSGFEAVIRGKPVVTFGKTFYDVLPDDMVRNVRCLEELPFEVKGLLESYRYSENDVICLVAAIMKSSVPLNLYEQILKKGGRVTVDSKTVDEQKREFADFLVKWAKGI